MSTAFNPVVDSLPPGFTLEHLEQVTSRELPNALLFWNHGVRFLEETSSGLPLCAAKTSKEWQEYYQERKSRIEIVERMNPACSVNIVVGDSGIGKSPLICQKAICVAAGIPFLGFKVNQGPVLIVDYENNAGLHEILTNISRSLGLEETPDNIRILHNGTHAEFAQSVRALRPALTVIDSMRGHNPEAEKDDAANEIKKLQGLMDEVDGSCEFIHHMRKPSNVPNTEAPDLENRNLPVVTYLNTASGSRALINQSFVRTAIAEISDKGEAVLIVRGYCKLEGEYGPIYIGRTFNDNGEAVSYFRVTGKSLLSPGDAKRFESLPSEFRFQEVAKEFSRPGDAVSFLERCISASLLTKEGKSKSKTVRYIKSVAPSLSV